MKKDLQTTFSTRQYMLSKDFEIYYYNDAHFSGVDSHTHDYYEFYFFLEGAITMYIDDFPHPMKPGDVLVLPPGLMHHAVSTDPSQPYRRFIFWISTDYCRQLEALSSSYVYVIRQAYQRRHIFHYDIIGFHALQAKIFRLIEEIHSERFGRAEKISLCVNDLMLHLNRTIYELNHPNAPQEKENLYENLLLYIEGHLAEELTLDSLADAFYVSKYHIAHIFKENLGLSIHQYITKKRLSMCCASILSGTDISKTYLMYGFKDYSSFFRAFRKEYGLSPKEYRKIHSVAKPEESVQTSSER